jgi:hypothetical protein
VVKWAQGVSGEMVDSRTSNKFYSSVTYGPSYEYQGLSVMDGSTDSLIKVVGLGDFGYDPFPCWCPVGNKVYSFASKGARLYIAVVDCKTDSVVRTMGMYDLGRWFEYLDNGLMLCDHTDSLALIDPRTDSALVDSSLAASAVYAVTHTGDGKKFYAVRWYGLEVRSSSSLSLLSTIRWPYYNEPMGTFLVYCDMTHRLYWLVEDSLLAIDATSDTVTARMGTIAPYNCARIDHTGRYLFFSSSATGRDSCLVVYDTQSDSLVAAYPHLPLIASIAVSPEQQRIYVGCSDLILAYPDAPPGVEETPNAEVRTTRCGPTVVRGVLMFESANGAGPTARGILLNVTGRKVLDLKSGANDVRALAPGVYFVREAQAQAQAVRKIVLTE